MVSGESFDFSSSFNQRLLVDILNLVFLANFLLGTINENRRRRRRRSWDSAFVSILCIAIGVAYFAGAGGVLYKEGNGFLAAIFSLRGLIWIALSVSINVHSSNWFRAILLIWWSSFPLLITALNANQLVKSHHLPLLDIIEWPATLILLFHALKLIIKGLLNGGITGESLSHSLLEEEDEEDVEEEEEEGIRSSNIGKAGIFSRLTFAWLNPLLHLGNSRALELNDIPSLDTEDVTIRKTFPLESENLANVTNPRLRF